MFAFDYLWQYLRLLYLLVVVVFVFDYLLGCFFLAQPNSGDHVIVVQWQ